MNGPLRWALLAAAAIAFVAMVGAALSVAWIAFSSTLTPFEEQEAGPQVVIGLDLSSDNPLITDAAFARQAGQRIEEMIAALPLRSRVSVRAFGDYGATAGPLTFDRITSARRQPDDVGRFIGRIIGGIPRLVAQGDVVPQTRTNILAFLDNMSHSVDCTIDRVEFYLVTDGLEDSEYSVLAKPDGMLPEPQGTPFAGCPRLTMIGIGGGQASPKTATRITEAWEAWALQAGFGTFRGLKQW
ncbi:MAG: hypothetical protein ACFB6R_16885 [Alphaproteobacteria bacterium]